MKRGRERGNVATTADGKEKVWAEQADAGMDELMAVLGYKIKSSDMANVAEKIEQLEMAAAADEGASVLSADAVQYNPSDLPAWVESMLSELSKSCCFDSILGESSSDEARFISDDDLRAIPGEAVFSNRQKDSVGDSDNVKVKRVKSEFSPGSEQLYKNPPTARPMLMVDSQETGVRLVHTLMACAEAVQQGNAKLADALVKHVGILAVAQIGAMRKVATYFGEALARRIYNIHPPDPLGPSFSDALQMHFYETVPYLKFAHFTANQAILEAFAGAAKVHVIDFGLKQGTQWPALLQALALRPGGPPVFRLTGIGPPQPDNADTLQEVGWKLAQVAQAIGIEFEFRGFVANSLADLDADVLEIRQGAAAETIAVNSVLEFHRLLSRPGAVEKVLSSIRALNPRVVTLVEHEASHNGVVFLERFNEALHYYSTMFDSVESARTGGQDAAAMAEAYLGRQICNVVACEGSERVERHEPLGRWRSRMSSAGFSPVHLGSDAFKQARMLLALFGGGDGYRVEENGGCLMLGWHTRPLIATSAWRPAAAEMV